MQTPSTPNHMTSFATLRREAEAYADTLEIPWDYLNWFIPFTTHFMHEEARAIQILEERIGRTETDDGREPLEDLLFTCYVRLALYTRIVQIETVIQSHVP
jgi:hypothetical protein